MNEVRYSTVTVTHSLPHSIISITYVVYVIDMILAHRNEEWIDRGPQKRGMAEDRLVDLQTKSQVLGSSVPSTFTKMEEGDPMTNNICELCFTHREDVLVVCPC